jgi:hypothetical protein
MPNNHTQTGNTTTTGNNSEGRRSRYQFSADSDELVIDDDMCSESGASSYASSSSGPKSMASNSTGASDCTEAEC